MRVKLEVLSGPMDGHIFQFNHSVEIGREAKLKLPVDRFVSRRHAAIEIKGACVYLTDNNSTNGTFIDEERIHGTVPLKNGQIFRIGRTWLEISW